MSTASEFYSKANDAFFEDDFDEALNFYTKAVEIDTSNAEYFIKRSATYSKLNKNQEALADAETALKLTEGKEDSKAIRARSFLRKGIASFALKDYYTAKLSFESSKELNPDEKSLITWLRKVDAELGKIPQKPLDSSPSTSAASKALDNSSPSPASPSSFLLKSRVRHEWFQNENYVTISIFIKNVKKDTVDVRIHNRSISVTVKLPSGSDYSLELDPLAHDIIPDESKYEVLSTKIEIKLKKANVGVKWGVLEGEDNIAGSISVSDAKLAYPSSARKAKNWDALEKEISKEKDAKEGEAALNEMFQELYKNADDDTKRAMLKSYTESSGTCLSTNWSEVKKGKVETKPPESMVAKKWNGGS
ncbi:hypothetical protein G9A89_013220 [Geosiphon pyriformis]|nr:hypothetical protein G9A89_013220 [Geosiphon pyriformis]